MKQYLFVLGRSVFLAAAELEAVLRKRLLFSDFSLTKNLVTIKSGEDASKVGQLIEILGGTVKIAEFVGSGDFIEIVSRDLTSRPVREVGFSRLDGSIAKNSLFDLKKKLKLSGRNIRLVLPKDNQTLNAAEIKGNKLIGKGREYLLSGADVFATLAIQDIDSQVERDFGKPRSNAVSGMVPPKLARMMVNLAASAAPVQSQKSKVQSVTSGLGTWDSGLVTVDPFCGSGNILLEAYDLGYQVQGSDISGGEVGKTTENLNWLANRKQPTENGQRITTIFQADATKDNFLKGLDPSQIVIVTEPYLGKPHKDKLTMAEAEAEIGPLLSLYQDFLGNCRRLKVKTMCLIFPSFTLTSGKSLGLYARIVDKLASLGYSTFVGPFEYGRDYQIVKREILLLKQKEDTSIK